MITTGAAVVNSRLEGGIAHLLPQLTGPQYLDRLCELADAMHHYGSKLVVQLTAAFGRVNFVQDYQSDSFSDQVNKTLELRATEAGWKIVREYIR